jgi:hypothetical protein
MFGSGKKVPNAGQVLRVGRRWGDGWMGKEEKRVIE